MWLDQRSYCRNPTVQMKESHKKLIEQFSKMANDGAFGDQIAESQSEYKQLPNGIPIMLKTVSDFCAGLSSDAPELAKMRQLACQTLIVAYREANRKDPDIASHFLNSFIQDYPGVPESCLLPRWTSLVNACLAFREIAHSQNRLLIWQQSLKQFQAYNEYLNGLFGYLIILWRTQLGKPVNPNVLNTSYGNKINQLSKLTGGDQGIFYFYLRLAQPNIRNAIAHESIWLDSDAAIVSYNHGNQNKIESQIDLVEFMTYVTSGSHIGQPYLAAIAVIATMEYGSELAKSLLPESYRKLFSHITSAT